MKVAELVRSFIYRGVKLPDPGPTLSIEQVRDMYIATYPELATARVEGPSPVGGTMQYTFTRAMGAKG